MISRRTQAVLSLAGVFILGAICGALGFGVFVRNEVRRMQQLRDREGFEEFLSDRLALRSSQRDSLRNEIEISYEDFAALRAAVAEEYAELIDSMDRRLAPKLTPEQRLHLRGAEMRMRRGMPMERHRMFDSMPAAPAAKAPGTSAKSPAPKPGSATPLAVPPTVSRTAPRADTVRVQDTMPNVPDAAEQVLTPLAARLHTELQLTDAQSQRVEGIVRNTRERIRGELADLGGFPRMQIGATMRALRDMDREVFALLNADQQTRYETLRRELRQQIQQRIWQGRGGMHGRGFGRGMHGRGPGMR